MANPYYLDELSRLRGLAGEFAKAHPALAPMLADPSTDPDVERLLEGVAFLTGMLREKLDDDFPEFIHGLAELIFPHYLRPVPSTTIVAFEPRPSLRESLRIPRGCSLASVPVEGVELRFRTCFDVELHPLALTRVEHCKQAGEPESIRLSFQLKGLQLSRWKPTEVAFHLGENLAEATDLFLLLTRHLKRIIVRPLAGGSPWSLEGDALDPFGFDLDKGLLPYPPNAYRGFRLLQEFFVLPQKYLFLALRGWEGWTHRGDGEAFTVDFELTPAPVPVPRLRAEHFVLFATPAVNLFAADAEPVLLDFRQERVRLRPSTQGGAPAQIFSVDRVTGFAQGSLARREYRPMSRLGLRECAEPVFQVMRSASPVDASPEVSLLLAFPPGSPGPRLETLSVALTCTQGRLPERLQLGDLCRPTEDSPELATFRNLLQPTSPLEPALGRNALWKLVSHLHLNLLSLASAEALQELLRLYVQQSGERAQSSAHLKRIEGIQDFRSEPSEWMLRGQVLRGHRITLKVRRDCFAGLGDLYLFGCLLDRLFGVFSSLNAFSRLTLEETLQGETFQWPTRTGDRPLI